MKVQFGVITDDGFAITMNQDPFSPHDMSRTFRRIYDQGPTWHASQCFDITAESANRPNIFSWYWYENGGGAVFHPFYRNCAGGGWVEIRGNQDPTWTNMCYFTQEIDAPMLTFGAYERGGQLIFQEKRFSPNSFVCSTPTGATYVKANSAVLGRDLVVMKLNSQPWIMPRQIAFSSTRTITVCFSLNDVDSQGFGRVLFGWFGTRAALWIVVEKHSPTTFWARLMCVANRITYTINFDKLINKDTWYVAAITLTTASKFSKKINGINFFIQELANLREGNVLTGITEKSIQPNVVLFDEVKVNPSITANPRLGDVGVKMSVAWLDFYDTTLPTSDTQLWKKVANRTWQGRWFQ